MSEKKMVSRDVAIVLGMVCILLIAGMGAVAAYYTMQINDKDSMISSLNTQIATKNSQISQLNSSATNLETQLSDLTSIVELNKSEVCYNTSALESPFNQGNELPANFSYPDKIGYISLTVYAPNFDAYAGVVLVQVSSSYDAYVNMTSSYLGQGFYYDIHVGENGTAVFPILPSQSDTFITVYTNDVAIGATALITIVYIY